MSNQQQRNNSPDETIQMYASRITTKPPQKKQSPTVPLHQTIPGACPASKYLQSSRGRSLQNYITQTTLLSSTSSSRSRPRNQTQINKSLKLAKSMSQDKDKDKDKDEDVNGVQDDVDSLEVSDMLKTVSHQKKNLTLKRWGVMDSIHSNLQLGQDDYKYFMMICSQANYRKLEYPGYYTNLLGQAKNYPQLFFSCINKDIPRTMPDDHPLQSSLGNILYAYAVRNPSLLYCQGMNYLVGFLLINKFSQEEAFWFMVQLIEDIVMPDYFKDLSTISLSVEVFENVVAHVFPQFHAEMKEVGMESGIFLVGWYICLFTKGFINSVSQYLLQQIVLQSFNYPIGFTLIRISLGIFATLFTRQQRFQFQSKDFKSLKESIESSVYEISLEELKTGMSFFDYDYEAYKSLISIYIKKREKVYAKAMEKELNEKKLSLPLCNKQSPVCIHRVEIEKKVGTVEQVLILKNNIPIKDQYIKDYFPSKINRQPPKIFYSNPEQCPITHHSHICDLPHQTKFLAHRKFEEQSEDYMPAIEGECSQEYLSRFSKIQDKFSEFSSFFVIDNTTEGGCGSLLSDDEDDYGMNEGSHVAKNGNDKQLFKSIGNVLLRALDGIKLFRTQFKESSAYMNNSKSVENSP